MRALLQHLLSLYQKIINYADLERFKEQHLCQLFENWSGEPATQICPLPPSGSYREYYRLSNREHQAIGVYNADRKENIAFLEFTRHFLKKGLAVPEVYAQELDQNVYLLEDLGDTTLFSHLSDRRINGVFPNELIPWYKKTLESLVELQVDAGKDLNYTHCYPRASFDKQSMMWDLNYFKYYFLKLAKVPFDEQLLEDDFHTFCDYLLQADCTHFLYRDFQARNIMLHNDRPYFIDYQGGRKGALQYDLASILYQAKANIPQEIRHELLEHYLNTLSDLMPIDQEAFIQHFYGYVLIRHMQVLGAYGFRGFFERKNHFLESIPYALNNLSWILHHANLPVETPILQGILTKLTQSEFLKKYAPKPVENSSLLVRVSSFSYKRGGIPKDPSSHGGGFVFDCRSIHNPGRYAPYKKLTGRDPEVIAFLKQKSNIDEFLTHVFSLVDSAVENYVTRNFDHLMVSFGCTGGQHRSVFCADALSKHLSNKYNIQVVLEHIEQEKKGWVNGEL